MKHSCGLLQNPELKFSTEEVNSTNREASFSRDTHQWRHSQAFWSSTLETLMSERVNTNFWL